MKSALFRRRRAAMMLFFCMVAVPAMTFVGVLSVEYQRFLIAQRTAEQLADAAAAAGVRQLLPNDPSQPNRPSDWLDKTKAEATARQVIADYESAIAGGEGAGWVSNVTTAVAVKNSSPSVAGSKTTIDVTVSYEIPVGGFTALAEYLFGVTGTISSGSGTGHAYVCVGGNGETYDKNCVEGR